MFINKKFKYFLLILLLIIFGILIYFSIVTNNYRVAKETLKSEINIEELKGNLKEEQKFEVEIKLNDNETYYNEVQDAYFYYVDVEKANTYIDFKLKILSKEKYKYIINNEKYNEEKGFCIDFENPINLIIYNNDSYYETSIKFTCLPIVNIKTEHEIPPYYQDTQIEVYSQNYKDPDKTLFIESAAQMKVRGAISSQYPKKQYKITLMYGDNKNKLALLGMNEDEDWILDAMFSDYSKIRTKLSFDIWNEMNSYTTDTTDIDVNSKYVEVYINQQYHGLYLLKEFVDWKKLGVDESTENSTGIVVKGIKYWDFDWENYDTEKKTTLVSPFEMKYPKEKTDYSKYWDTIIDKVYTHFYDRENITEEYVFKNFDINNYNDYKIFIHVICGADNFGEKNVFLHMDNMKEDTKVIFTPWDLDTTYGYEWNGEGVTYIYEDPTYYTKVDGLLTNSNKLNDLLKERYFELRENVLSVDNIYKKIDSYYEQLKYVIDKDSNRWFPTDLEAEINKIKQWYKKRVEFLDEYLGDNDV